MRIVPGQPMDLSARAISDSEILIGWSPPESDGGATITGYKIDYSIDEGASWIVLRESTGTTNTLFRHYELESGVLYRYRVSAVNKVGAGEASEFAEARTYGIPDQPNSLVVSAVSSSQINIQWSPPTYTGGVPITGYILEGSEDGGGRWEVLYNPPPATRSFGHRNLKAGTLYLYRVKAINAIGVGKSTPTQGARTLSEAPDPPRDLTARASGPERIDLRWRIPIYDGGSAIEGYQN